MRSLSKLREIYAALDRHNDDTVSEAVRVVSMDYENIDNDDIFGKDNIDGEDKSDDIDNIGEDDPDDNDPIDGR